MQYRRVGKSRWLASPPGSVVEIDRAVAEPAFVQQLEIQTDVVAGKRAFGASHHDRHEKEVILVDHSSLDRLCRKLGTTDGYVPRRCRLQLPHRFRIELSLDSGSLARCRLQRLGVDDLFGRLPDLGEIPYERGLVG